MLPKTKEFDYKFHEQDHSHFIFILNLQISKRKKIIHGFQNTV